MDIKNHRRAINAWTMYDWANSAFATTVMAAVLPVYYESVAFLLPCLPFPVPTDRQTVPA